MADNPLLFLSFRIILTSISVGLAIVIYRREAESPGSQALGLTLVLGAVWILSDALERSTNFDLKVIANKIQYTAVLVLPALWLLAAGVIALPAQQRRWTAAYATCMSLLTAAVIFTNEYHHLFWEKLAYSDVSPSAPLLATRGGLFWILLLHSILIISVSSSAVVLTSLRSRPFQVWRNAGLVSIGLLIGLAGVFDGLLPSDLSIFGHDFDLVLFSLMITVAALSFTGLRWHRADLLPAARARLVASFSDAILILDSHNQVVDLNPSAEQLLRCPVRDAIGKPIQTLLPGLPLMLEGGIGVEEKVLEYPLGNSPEQRLFDTRISYLHKRRGRAPSPVIVLRDITERKRAETAIRQRNEELATLTEVGAALNQLAEPAAMLELIFAMIGRVVDSSNLYIALYDEEQERIDFPVYTIQGTRRERTSRAPGNGLTEYVLRTKAPLLINENMEAALMTLGIVPFGTSARSYLGVPMLVGDKAIGVIAIQDYEQENIYEDNHISVLKTTAAQAASALANARLYDRAQREILERKRVEDHLRALLAEKEILLKEIHHRVKNNLQIISSLLNLQAANLHDQLTLAQFQDSQDRIRSMALVHERLYRSNDLARIDFGSYLRDLTSSLVQTYRGQAEGIALQVEADAVWLNIDTAIPCGLLVNELVSNALKHAFPDGRGGTVTVELRCEAAKQVRLVVQDDGVGFPAGIDYRNTTSLGLQLVNSLARQFDATLELQGSTGVSFLIRFPQAELNMSPSKEPQQ